jgi:hypothetical protein
MEGVCTEMPNAEARMTKECLKPQCSNGDGSGFGWRRGLGLSRLIQANAGSLKSCSGEAWEAGGSRGWGLPRDVGGLGLKRRGTPRSGGDVGPVYHA